MDINNMHWRTQQKIAVQLKKEKLICKNTYLLGADDVKYALNNYIDNPKIDFKELNDKIKIGDVINIICGYFYNKDYIKEHIDCSLSECSNCCSDATLLISEIYCYKCRFDDIYNKAKSREYKIKSDAAQYKFKRKNDINQIKKYKKNNI